VTTDHYLTNVLQIAAENFHSGIAYIHREMSYNFIWKKDCFIGGHVC